MGAVKSSSSHFGLVFLVFFVVAALLLVTAEASKSYGVNSLSHSSCRFAQDMESGVLGDDRSPVVVGSKGIYYVGDGRTGSFYQNLTLQNSTTTKIDGLFSDLGDGRLWTLGTSSSAWLTRGDANLDPTRITHLIPLAADAEGNLSTDEGRDVVALSSALNPRYYPDLRPMVFYGMGEFVFASVIQAPSEFAGAFLVDIASGNVTHIHEMADGDTWRTDPLAQQAENWAASGVMERTAAGIKLLAAYGNEEEEDTFVGGIYRYNLDGSLHSKLYTGYLDDAATFTVNYWSNDDKRWFAHGEEAPYKVDGVTPRIPGLTEDEWILSCAADHYNGSGASTTSCAVCSLVSALWSFF